MTNGSFLSRESYAFLIKNVDKNNVDFSTYATFKDVNNNTVFLHKYKLINNSWVFETVKETLRKGSILNLRMFNGHLVAN